MNLSHSGAVVAVEVNTKRKNEAHPMLITLAAYLIFFSAPFFGISLSTLVIRLNV